MTLRTKFTALALAAATAASVGVAASPAQANDGRGRAFAGGVILGTIIGNTNPYGYGRTRVYEPRTYYIAPPRRWHRHHHHRRWERWHHRHEWHEDWYDR